MNNQYYLFKNNMLLHSTDENKVKNKKEDKKKIIKEYKNNKFINN
jgi:hypothetical protein|tara:strand:- start:281 stop:415 length:135 start_codon:yes stop_codon:yes gene_type:complete